MRYACVIECQSSPAGDFSISAIVDLNILPRIVQLLSTTKDPDLHVRSSPFGQSDLLNGSEVDVVCIIGSTVCVKSGCGTVKSLMSLVSWKVHGSSPTWPVERAGLPEWLLMPEECHL